jgi:hypothetical protein
MVDLDVVLDVGVGLSMLDAVRTGPKYLSLFHQSLKKLIQRNVGLICAVFLRNLL